MISDNVVPAWAAASVERIELAISQWNRTKAAKRRGLIRVVWGYRDTEETAREKSRADDEQRLSGLLDFGDLDIELMLLKNDNRMFPNLIDLQAVFPEPQEMPSASRDIYNLLESLAPNVSFGLWPESDDGETGDAILLMAVGTSLPLENLTAKTLHDALQRLAHSWLAALDWLVDGKGDDQWQKDTDS